jgi:hypothetical protein
MIRIMLNCMNLNEAVELLKAVSAIPISNSSKHPEIRIVHTIGEVNTEGYTPACREKFSLRRLSEPS